MENVIRGYILNGDKYTLIVDERVVDITVSRKVRNHSYDFAWGYLGSGPSQTALAILIDVLSNVIENKDKVNRVSLLLYHDFKEEFIATQISDESFTLRVNVVRWVLAKLQSLKDFAESNKRVSDFLSEKVQQLNQLITNQKGQ